MGIKEENKCVIIHKQHSFSTKIDKIEKDIPFLSCGNKYFKVGTDWNNTEFLIETLEQRENCGHYIRVFLCQSDFFYYQKREELKREVKILFNNLDLEHIPIQKLQFIQFSLQEFQKKGGI